MKFIDELFGPPICLLFTFYNALKKPFLKYKLDPTQVNNIVLIKFFGMGSILLAGPMMRALKNKFSKAKIISLTFSSNNQICRRIDLIDEVICVETETFLKFVTTMIKAILKIRRRRCEISIDLEFFSKLSTLIQYLCNTRIRVGYYLIQIGILLKMMWRGNLLTNNVYYNPHRHASEAFLALARSIGAQTNDLSPTVINITNEDRARLNALLSEAGVNSNDYLVTVNINASPLCLERRWPFEKFAELIRRILNYNSVIKIILIGDTLDSAYVNLFVKIMRNFPRLFNLSGKLDIGMLLALLEKSKLFISNDSGPLHIANSLGISTVSFFGPEIPERFAPRGDKHTVFYSGVYCSPCLNVYNQKTAPCNGENECMRKISVEDVYSIIKEKYLK